MIEFYTREIQNGRENIRLILNRFSLLKKRRLSQQVYYRMYKGFQPLAGIVNTISDYIPLSSHRYRWNI